MEEKDNLKPNSDEIVEAETETEIEKTAKSEMPVPIKKRSMIFKVIVTAMKWIVFLSTPYLSYLLFESITGNLSNITGIYLQMNLFFFYLFYFALFMITGSVRRSYPWFTILLAAVAIGEYFVVEFRQKPIMPADILAFRTAMAVAENYSYELTPHLIRGILYGLALVCASLFFSFRIKKKRYWILSAVNGIALVILAVNGFFYYAQNHNEFDLNMWNVLRDYEERGFMLCTLRAIDYLGIKQPKGYSMQAVEQTGEQFSEEKQELLWDSDSEIVPTNIICIMNESLADLSVIGDFETNVPYLEYYNKILKNSIKGNLYVPVFGALTCNTEFEFLTGNSLAFEPSGTVPYLFFMNNPTFSLPRILKDQGYRTVAVHANSAQNWNRDTAYEALGFDEFLTEDAFDSAEMIRYYASDRANNGVIAELTSSKKEGEPLFVFAITMQNHGGYTAKDFRSAVRLLGEDEGKFPQAEQYLSLILESDQAFKELLDYYSNIEEPTMVVMFGDHQPSVEPEFYERLFGKSMNGMENETYIDRFVTPFIVWTNYETGFQKVDSLSVNYLPMMILERANLSMPPFYNLLDTLCRKAPMLHYLGYQNEAGEWEEWENWESKMEAPYFHALELLQYNSLHDLKRRKDYIYSLQRNAEE